MAFAHRAFSARFAKGAVFALALAVASAGCTKKDEAKVDQSKTSDKAEAIPSDFVLNPFMPDDKDTKQAVRVRGGDAGLDASFASGAGTAGAKGTGDPQAGGAAPEDDDANAKEKIVEPGAEPRAERRYAFTIGKAETRVATIKIASNGAEQPGLKVTMAITATAKTPKGFAMQVKIAKLELIPNNEREKAMVAQAGAALAQATGMSAQFDVTPRGKKTALQMSTADGKKLGEAAEQVAGILTQATDLMLPPLPAAPIGVGGKWEQRNSQTTESSKSEVTSTFVLKSFTDNVAVISGENVVKANNAQQDPRSQRVLKEVVDGKGTYEWTLKFDHLPTKVGGELTTNVMRSMGDKSQSQSVKVRQSFEEPGAK